MDKISIVVPVYNLAPYIEKCVRSICNQTYQNIEVILVDDGSSDDSYAIMKELASDDDRILIIHQENGGVTKARVTGIKASSGDWIAFVDGDDFIDPEMYGVLMENAEKYAADISHCGYKMIFPNHIDYYYDTGRCVVQENKDGVKDLIEGAFIEPGLCNKMYRKSLLMELIDSEQMDYSIKNLEDLLMNYYLFKKAKKSVFIDRCYYHYMVRKGSAATGKISENKLKDPLKVFDIIKKDVQGNQNLEHILDERIANQLVNLATMKSDGSTMMRDVISNAKKRLKEHKHIILSGDYSKRLKTMTRWASISPATYRSVHKLYARIRGTDKKYVVED